MVNFGVFVSRVCAYSKWFCKLIRNISPNMSILSEVDSKPTIIYSGILSLWCYSN